MSNTRSVSGYKPKQPFTVPMRLLIPTSKRVQGVLKPTYPAPDDAPLFYGSFRTFGGTENTSNGVYTIIDTATIDTWYRPDITANCRVYLCDTSQTYDIISDPENIDMRNQYLQFRVQKVGGKA